MNRERSRSPDRRSYLFEFTENPFTGKPYSNKYHRLVEERKHLPVCEALDKLENLLAEQQVIVIQGETGSGKTTQIPQYILYEGYAGEKMIACTQPRRVAAMSVARRVSEEMDVELGQEVGYSVRFEECSSNKTILKYLTDGMLLREAMADPLLEKYSVIILDEAHERTLSTDILLGLLKYMLKQRADLKLIIMSATIEAEKFQSYFSNAPLLSIPGRLFPVEILYSQTSEENYPVAAVRTVIQIHSFEDPGDILVFLTGEEEIEHACKLIRKEVTKYGESLGKLAVIPIYSSLPPAMQQKIFEAAPGYNTKGIPGRKCIVATNIAETSLTIDGIVYVVDAGLSKQKVYNPRLRVESLLVAPISKASAKQRAGRAGRTRPGKCYRLYTEKTYQETLQDASIPEILRSNLTNVVLTMKVLSIHDLANFDFLDPPNPETMMRALETLNFLNAVDDDGELTSEGRWMAEFPLDVEMSKILISSPKYVCSEEILTLVSVLSSHSPFVRTKEHAEAADKAKAQFIHQDGDFLTLLTVFNEYMREGQSIEWCNENFLNPKSLKSACEIREQLSQKMTRLGLPLISQKNNLSENLRKCLVCGFFMHVVHQERAGVYITLKEKQQVGIHPSSNVGKPEWAIYHEFVITPNKYIRTVSPINAEWLLEIAPHYFELSRFPDSQGKKMLERLQRMMRNRDKEEDEDD